VGPHYCGRLRFLAAQTETETVCPGELSEEQTSISLFWDRGLGKVTSALTLRRDVESRQGKPPENKSPKKPVPTESIPHHRGTGQLCPNRVA